MLDEYIWLLKGDVAYKSYLAKEWKTIISVKIENGDIYYCLSKNKQFIQEDEKLMLLAPICINNKSYKDCVIILNENEELGFLWKQNRCFSIKRELANEFSDSTLNFFNGNIITVASSAQLVSENSIAVKSASIIPIIILTICFIALFIVGMYIWLL